MKALLSKIAISCFKLISSIPLSILYGFASFLAFFAKYILKYRNTVIKDNLNASFPKKNETEISTIQSNFYQHFARLIVETLKSFTISKNKLLQKVQFKNLELLQQFQDKNQPVIVVMGHYANWEMIGISGGLQSIPFYSLYRKQKNEIINAFIVKNRQRFGLRLIEEKQAIRELPKLLSTNEFNCLVFIADQAITPKRAYWVNFLNRQATFVKGPELYARKYNCPVLFSGTKIDDDGNYHPYFELITKQPKELEEGEITKQFANRLEQLIINKPEFWLWSHRRWKHKYQAKEE